jgi:hypothetical protein
MAQSLIDEAAVIEDKCGRVGRSGGLPASASFLVQPASSIGTIKRESLTMRI